MGLLDSEIKQIVGDALVDAGLSIPVTLVKVTPTARNASNPTAGTTPSTTSYPCQGFVANTAYFQIQGLLVADANRVIKIYGSTLPAGVRPAPFDQITADGVSSTVVDNTAAVTVDPAGAVWTAQTK